MDDAKRPEISELREKLLGGLTPFADFAAAMNRHPKTVMRMNPPVVKIGRSVYVPTETGRAWLLSGCRPAEQRGRARRGQD
jgi:hypothetical protein